MLFSVAGESQSCHKGQCGRRRVVSSWQGAEHQIQDCQVNLYKPVFLYTFSLLVNFGYWKISCKSLVKGEWVARVHVAGFVYESTWRNQMSLEYSDREITYKLPSERHDNPPPHSCLVVFLIRIKSINQSIFIVHYMYLQNSKVVLQFDHPESKYLCQVECHAIKLQVYLLCF